MATKPLTQIQQLGQYNLITQQHIGMCGSRINLPRFVILLPSEQTCPQFLYLCALMGMEISVAMCLVLLGDCGGDGVLGGDDL